MPVVIGVVIMYCRPNVQSYVSYLSSSQNSTVVSEGGSKLEAVQSVHLVKSRDSLTNSAMYTFRPFTHQSS